VRITISPFINVVTLVFVLILLYSQGGHQPGKRGKVGEFESGQGKVRENAFMPVVCFYE